MLQITIETSPGMAGKKNSNINLSLITEKKIYKELIESTDRSKAIVGGAILEELLERLLRKHMVQDNKVIDQLFQFGSSFTNVFASKIKLAFLLGLISKELYDDLEIIKEIRNRFAHNIYDSDFSDQSISAKLQNLKFITNAFPADYLSNLPADGIFTLEVAIVYIALIKKIVRAHSSKSIEFEINDLGYEQIDLDYLNNKL